MFSPEERKIVDDFIKKYLEYEFDIANIEVTEEEMAQMIETVSDEFEEALDNTVNETIALVNSEEATDGNSGDNEYGTTYVKGNDEIEEKTDDEKKDDDSGISMKDFVDNGDMWKDCF